MNISRAQALHELQAHQAQVLARILQELPEDHPHVQSYQQRTFKTNPADLRGIPAIGRGVAGAIPGTAPHHL